MDIANLLAQGTRARPAGMEQNALMQGQEMQQRRMQNALMQMQMQAAQEKQAQDRQNALMQQNFINSIPSPQMQASQAALAGGGGPTVANAAQMKPVDPRTQMLHDAMRARMVSPVDYINAAMPAPAKPERKVVGDALLEVGTDGVKELYKGTPKEDADVALLRRVHGDGTPAFMAALRDLARKKTTHAPAPSMTVNTAKPLLNEIAGGLGKQIDNTLAGARAATNAITTAHTLMSAVDTGKIVAGPGSSFRVFGLQLGQMLGVGGSDGAEVLANTRTAIQSMAQSELDAAQQMKGQGQITEAERDIIRRAASGNIDGMTAPEIRLLAGTMEKMARVKIKSHQSNVEALRKMPEAAPLLPFYSVEEPPAYGGSKQGVRKYNPVTQRIE